MYQSFPSPPLLGVSVVRLVSLMFLYFRVYYFCRFLFLFVSWIPVGGPLLL